MVEFKNTQVTFRVEVPREDMPVAESANWFHLMQFNSEVELLAGFIDALEIAQATQSRGAAGEVKLQPEVTRRIVISPVTLMQLRQQVNTLAEKMIKQGVIVEQAGPPTK